jgi:hypothetical protein
MPQDNKHEFSVSLQISGDMWRYLANNPDMLAWLKDELNKRFASEVEKEIDRIVDSVLAGNPSGQPVGLLSDQEKRL